LLASSSGNHRAALRLLSGLPEQVENPLERTIVRHNQVWILIQAMAAGAIAWEMDRLRSLTGSVVDSWLRLDNETEVGEALTNLAYAELSTGALEAARATWARAIEQDPGLDAQPFGLLLDGWLARAAGKLDAADAAFSELLARGEADRNPDYVWRAHYGRAQVEEARGRDASAGRAYARALAIRREAAQGAALRFGRSTFAADRATVVADAAAFFVGRGDVDRAFRLIDEARGRTLRDLESRLRVGRLEGAERAEYLEELGRYRRLREAYEASRREVEALPPEARAAAAKDRARLRRDMKEAFDGAYAALEAGAPTSPFRGAGTASVAKALASDEGLLLAHAVENRSFRFLVTTDGTLHRVGSSTAALPSTWAARIGRLGHLYAAAEPEVADRLLGPPANELGPTVSHVPFASLLLQPPTAGRRAPLVVADPGGDLPHARREGRWVAEHLDGSRLFTGGAATREALVAALSAPAVFHFAGHGVAAAQDPWRAHLKLASSERLTLEDLLSVQPGAELVVLSGCETGRAGALSRQETVSLADAFLISGARSVLASDEAVRDADVVALMRAFYAEGGVEHPARALAAARTALKARGSGVGRAFRLYGRR